ncbi:MAG: hypothetical protein UT01_C0063G0012 [Candidatus Daviesbacteria bacterium GW2011_GWA1_38_7]|nr:MAG: hypothetical protein UT01_C0063G0012 [Candidatus Daviesbacteria bacterium GW2011_GWA1_38_7]
MPTPAAPVKSKAVAPEGLLMLTKATTGPAKAGLIPVIRPGQPINPSFGPISFPTATLSGTLPAMSGSGMTGSAGQEPGIA